MAWSSRKSQLRTGYCAPSQLVKSICSRWTSEPVRVSRSQRFTSSSAPLPVGAPPSNVSAPLIRARGRSTSSVLVPGPSTMSARQTWLPKG